MKRFTKFIAERALEVPAKKDTMKISRKDMPQIKSNDIKTFLADLNKKGVKTVKKTVSADSLKATQGEFDKAKIQGFIDTIESGSMEMKPIIVSKDGYVIDGHHRWLAYSNLSMKIDIFHVNKNAKEIMEIMHKYSKSFTKELKEGFELVCERDDSCPYVSAAQLKSFESVVDKLFKAFKIDFDFGKRHFRERITDERNNPCIDLKELAMMIKKLYMQVKKKGDTLTKHKDTEIVLKDIQSKLNMPLAIEYNRRNDELDVIAMTIMRKKDFKTPNTVVKV